MDAKSLLIGLIVGLILGLVAFSFIGHRYQIAVSRDPFIVVKCDTWTGQTWVSRGEKWLEFK